MNDATRAQLTEVLRECAMTPDLLDLRTLTELIFTQMRIALYGGRSSIPMLPTFLRPSGDLPDDQPVAVAEIDDREIRVSLVRFQGGKPSVTDQDSFPVPGRDYPAPLEDLLFATAELLEPLLDQVRDVALCLPFPVDYDSQGDGVIRRFPGSMTVREFQDKPALTILRNELAERGFDNLHLVLISEPDAVLLDTKYQIPAEEQKNHRCLGLTWGSTIDGGFVAPGSIVLRWLAIPGHLMLFDGGFSSFEQIPFGLADLPKDRDCYAPGEDLLLKAVSTDYLGDTFRLVMLKAAERKLLSFGCSRDILSLTTLDLASVTDFIQDPVGGGTIAHFCREPADREIGLAVADAVLDRAARLVCAVLAAMLRFIGAGKQHVSLGFWGEATRYPELLKHLSTHMDRFVRADLGYQISLAPLNEHAVAVGSAVAALYNR